MDKHRNYGDIPFQGRGSFEPDKIKGVIEAPLAGLVLGLGPSFTYDREEDSAGGNTFVNRFAKIAPRLDGSDIHEDRVFAKLAGKIVEQTSRFAFRIISAIAEKNCSHCDSPELSSRANTVVKRSPSRVVGTVLKR
jgi:hypothetical protein